LKNTDYLIRNSVTFEPHKDYLYAYINGRKIVFSGNYLDILPGKINTAMELAVAYYSNRVQGAVGTRPSTQQIEQVSLEVIASFFSMYCNWKTHRDNYKDLDLVVSKEDLDSVKAQDAIERFCKNEYADNYQIFAAMLMGFNSGEYSDWKDGRDTHDLR
jgi:hypothetical protein